jgi:hypothetical protein
VNYVKLLEMNSFFTLHSFLEVGKTQDLPSKFWQTLGDALTQLGEVVLSNVFPKRIQLHHRIRSTSTATAGAATAAAGALPKAPLAEQ